MIKPILLLSLLFTGSPQYSNKRLLLIFADRSNNAELVTQKQLLGKDEAGLRERDMEVKIYLQHQNTEEFTRYHIKEPFTIILIGKDGGEKLRTHQVLSLQELYGTIDAMPMRKAEIKTGKQ